ncbi:MAG TPA: dTDP-4-dehydrorhamnose 3,5-epimerase [Solirubrobacteraceae bacterium]|nr:dTDP-4-dehydrorhamnose 3,5-epimerase [Solirubrobacteraceae bacterium]
MPQLPTRIPGLVLLAPQVHGDHRGFFVETYRASDAALRGVEFVQDNHSRSRRGVVRGLHLQIGAGIGKLVRCGRGEIFDVAVDVRRGSPHYGRWEGYVLDDRAHRQLYVPAGFAHGFCVLSDVADVFYRQTGYYDPDLERGIAYDDPEVAVEWPLPAAELIASERDAGAPRLAEAAAELPFVFDG